MSDRRYRYTIEVIDVVGGSTQAADIQVSARSDDRWNVMGEGFTFIADTLTAALSQVASIIDNLIAQEEPF
jgi:hypothetical protein